MLAAALSSWEFDAFRLAEVTQGHGVSTLAYYLMHKMGLLKHFKIKPQVLAR